VDHGERRAVSQLPANRFSIQLLEGAKPMEVNRSDRAQFGLCDDSRHLQDSEGATGLSASFGLNRSVGERRKQRRACSILATQGSGPGRPVANENEQYASVDASEPGGQQRLINGPVDGSHGYSNLGN
jgi:hypothetical protein